MACVPCGRGGPVQEFAKITSYQPTADGGYELFKYPGCTALHHGVYEGRGAFAVARGTENERLFRFTQLAEASTYATSGPYVIESLPTSGLCDQAVIDLYS